MHIDTRNIDSFLTDKDIAIIEPMVMNIVPHENFNPHPNGGTVKSGDYYIFDYYDPAFTVIKDILDPKLLAVFGQELFMEQIHIFDCVDPYRIHSDVDSGWKKSPYPTDPAWTLIIPLCDVDSHTIVFEEGSNNKNPGDYTKTVPPYNPSRIDAETKQKYFSHVPSNDPLDWLTIEDIFKWKKGAMFAADRFKFHTSDNFPANGVASKRALIAWTRTKV